MATHDETVTIEVTIGFSWGRVGPRVDHSATAIYRILGWKTQSQDLSICDFNPLKNKKKTKRSSLETTGKYESLIETHNQTHSPIIKPAVP